MAPKHKADSSDGSALKKKAITMEIKVDIVKHVELRCIYVSRLTQKIWLRHIVRMNLCSKSRTSFIMEKISKWCQVTKSTQN